jgi:NAD(P)-dependent dehydrogenase (short-subunit alcohol dehydrogenase family)
MPTILVTGANGNLGRALVERFLAKGHQVIGCISQNENHIGINNPNLDVFPVDLTNPDACKIFVEVLTGRYKSIDCLILTVGGFKAGRLDEITPTDFEKMFTLNFYTAFNIVKPALMHMKKTGASAKFILIGAEPGTTGMLAKSAVAYGFSKSLLFRMVELINEEGKENGITAEILVIGTMDTQKNRLSNPDADFSTWILPEKIAENIEELCFQPINNTALA